MYLSQHKTQHVCITYKKISIFIAILFVNWLRCSSMLHPQGGPIALLVKIEWQNRILLTWQEIVKVFATVTSISNYFKMTHGLHSTYSALEKNENRNLCSKMCQSRIFIPGLDRCFNLKHLNRLSSLHDICGVKSANITKLRNASYCGWMGESGSRNHINKTVDVEIKEKVETVFANFLESSVKFSAVWWSNCFLNPNHNFHQNTLGEISFPRV